MSVFRGYFDECWYCKLNDFNIASGPRLNQTTGDYQRYIICKHCGRKYLATEEYDGMLKIKKEAKTSKNKATKIKLVKKTPDTVIINLPENYTGDLETMIKQLKNMMGEE